MKIKYGPSVLNLVRLSSRYRKRAVWGWVEGCVVGAGIVALIAWLLR